MSGTDSPRSMETRLGLVMCGGVSLAIYINGISYEFFRAVRGRGIYGLLKDLSDSEIVVDIVSGSSAGGLNAILLSTALCNEGDFGATAKFWRDKADFDALLHPPASHGSILDGNYHEAQLQEALQIVMRPDPTTADTHVSRFEELDLFITGTDVNGRSTSVVDDAGHVLQITDYKTLFWLKHRKDRKQPFHPLATENGSLAECSAAEEPCFADTNSEALARLGHITSCFPGAFEPVVVRVPAAVPASPAKRCPESVGSVDGRLACWGGLKDTSVLIDGGVLDNKPFTVTLDAIFSRLADVPVTRQLLFIEPEPDETAARLAQARTASSTPAPAKPIVLPGFSSIVVDALSTLPRYQSIAGDLRALHDHNDHLLKYRKLVDAVNAWPAGADPANAPGQNPIYARALLWAWLEMCFEALFDDAAGPANQQQARGKPNLLDASFEVLSDPELQRQLRGFDIEFRLRRLYSITYYQVPSSSPTADTVTLEVPQGPGASKTLQVDAALFALLNRQLEVLIVLRWQIQRVLQDKPNAAQQLAENPKEFWPELVAVLQAQFAKLEPPKSYASYTSAAPLAPLLNTDELKKYADELKKLAEAPAPGGPGLALSDCDDFERKVLERCPDLLAVYTAFEQVDAVALPLEIASGLHEKDVIHTVRVSPIDAQRGLSRFQGGAKLCGAQLADFGSFFKKSWRSNDNLWGRLDGACGLTETLLDPERLRKPEVRSKLRQLHGLTDARVSELFPTSGAAAQANLKRWLSLLTGAAHAQDAAIAELKRSLTATDGTGILAELILAEQLEILRADLPAVLDDDVADAARLSAKHRRQAAQARSEAARYLTDGSGRGLTNWFQTAYSIPKQRLGADVPRASLWELGARFAWALIQALLRSRTRRLDDPGRRARRA